MTCECGDGAPPLPRRNRQQQRRRRWCWWRRSGGGALHSNQPFTSSSRPLFWAIYSLLGALTKSCLSPRCTLTEKTKAMHRPSQVKIGNYKEHQMSVKNVLHQKRDQMISTQRLQQTQSTPSAKQVQNAGFSQMLRKHG